MLKAILPNGDEIDCTDTMLVFHGTNFFPPVDAFATGVPDKGKDRRLLDHVRGNNHSAFRGSTTAPLVSPHGQGAANWAGVDGWVYAIDGVPSWHVERVLQGRVPVPGGFGDAPNVSELEHAIPARVPANNILRAAQVQAGRYVAGQMRLRLGPWIENQNP